jgi:hypothetical protein
VRGLLTQRNHRASIPSAGIAGRNLPAHKDNLMTQAAARAARTTDQADILPAAPDPGPETSEAGGAAASAAPIPQAAMQDAVYARNWWRVVFNAERTSYASLLADVSVWGPNEAKLRAGDVVEVLDEQSTVFALLYLVEHVPAKSIRFAELIKAPLGGRAVGRAEARGHHYAQWRGPARRWCVIGPTGMVLRDGILTKEEAERDVTTRNTPTSMAFVNHPRM